MPRKKRRRAEPSPLIELVTAAEGRPLTADEAVQLRCAITGGETARRSNGGLQAALQLARADAARWLAFIEHGMETHTQFGVIKPDGTTEMLPCADWCYACKLEKAEAERDRLAAGVPLVCCDELHEAKVRGLTAELARFHEGEEPPGDPLAWATPAQWIWKWNRATPVNRLEVAEFAIRSHQVADACLLTGRHKEQLAELEQRRVRADTAEARAAKLHAAFEELLSYFSDNSGDWYMYDPKVDGGTMADWRAVLDESGCEQPAVVHPDTQPQASEPPTVDERCTDACSEQHLYQGSCVLAPIGLDGVIEYSGSREGRPGWIWSCSEGELAIVSAGHVDAAMARRAYDRHRRDGHGEDIRPDSLVDNPSPETASPQANQAVEPDNLAAISGPLRPADWSGHQPTKLPLWPACPLWNAMQPHVPHDLASGVDRACPGWPQTAPGRLPRRTRLRPGLIEQMITAARQQTPDVDVQLVQVGQPLTTKDTTSSEQQ